MDRRSFLTSLLAGFAVDPERLLYRPGAKLISIPAPTLHRVAEPAILLYKNGILQLDGVHYTRIGQKVTFFEVLHRDDLFHVDSGVSVHDRLGWFSSRL